MMIKNFFKLKPKKDKKNVIRLSSYFIPFAIYIYTCNKNYSVFTKRYKNLIYTLSFFIISIFSSYDDFFDYLILVLSIYFFCCFIYVELVCFRIRNHF